MSGEVKCSACGVTAWPQMSLNSANKIKPACPACGRDHEQLEVDDFQATAGHAPKPKPIATKASEPKERPVVARRELSPKDVMKLARARLREVEREIKRLHGLEKERDELKRMLTAARPVAIVRQIGKAVAR